MKINQIIYRDIDIEIVHKTKKGETYLEWTFSRNGNRYGNAVKFSPNSKVKAKEQLIGAVASLVANAILTYEDLLKEQLKQCK